MAMSPERKAQRAASRKREKELMKLAPIADKVEVASDGTLTLLLDGVLIQGSQDNFNKVLERMGFRPVRTTRNLLNPNSRTWCIDVNTPGYLDPGSESYHTM